MIYNGHTTAMKSLPVDSVNKPHLYNSFWKKLASINLDTISKKITF